MLLFFFLTCTAHLSVVTVVSTTVYKGISTTDASECTTSRVGSCMHIHAQFLMLAAGLVLTCDRASDPRGAEEATPSFKKQTPSQSPGKTYVFCLFTGHVVHLVTCQSKMLMTCKHRLCFPPVYRCRSSIWHAHTLEIRYSQGNNIVISSILSWSPTQMLLSFQQNLQRSQAVQSKQCVSMQYEHPVLPYL